MPWRFFRHLEIRNCHLWVGIKRHVIENVAQLQWPVDAAALELSGVTAVASGPG